jgi:hypothetical protein
VSIGYSLELATGTTIAEVLRRVAETAGSVDGSITADRLADGVIIGRGPWVRVLKVSPAPWQVVVTDLGITATVSIAYRLLKDADLAAQEDELVRLTFGVLDVVPGDAVLHRESETIWLLRRGGELSLHESAEVWTPARLAIAGSRAYTRTTWSFAD